MWYITHTLSGSRFYFTGDKSIYTVGRLGADIELQADVCVSRSHAAFHVSADKIELEDVGSKYGTFHNKGIEKNTPLEKGRKVKLECDDLLRFGRLQNVWKVEKFTCNVVTSALSEEDVDQVTDCVGALGGKVLRQWSPDCTHLTMKQTSVTVKLLHALVDQKCIVTTNYWKDLSKAVASKKDNLPKPELYCPQFDDANVDIGCRPERRHLFKNKCFVFLSRKHVDMYGPLVTAACGMFKDINSGVQKSFLIKSNVIVIQYNPSTQTQSSQTINTIAEFLESHSKRIIPEYEIGLAILNCSLDEFCNPNYKMQETNPQSLGHGIADNSMTVDLTEGDTTPSISTEDFEVPGTNKHLVTSTPYENPMPSTTSSRGDSEDNRETMPNIYISETPAEETNRKRKHKILKTIDIDESDDDDLFQFSKKTKSNQEAHNIKKKASSNKERTNCSEVVNNSKKTEEDKAMQNIAEQHITEDLKSTNASTKNRKKSAFADFLEKTQNKAKAKSSSPASPTKDVESLSSSSTNKVSRKRPRIQILGEDNVEGDEDDLFCFGDTQTNKNKRNKTQNKRDADSDHEEDSDLFGFKEKDPNTANQLPPDEDSNDMQATEEFVVQPKAFKASSYVVIKPNNGSRKISALDWISGSLGKINIKGEVSSVIKPEECIKSDIDIKPNFEDLELTDDHRKWLDSLKNAIEIQEVSLNSTLKINEKSLYKFKNQHNTSFSREGAIRNFKTFVKKYKPSEKDAAVVQLHAR